MLPEIRELEGRLKQILYGCVEHIQATKAALYLSASADLNDKQFELVTSYQYSALDRRVVDANDDLVDRLAVKRSVFFVNGLAADPRFAEMLFRQGNDRLLAAPMFSRGRLLGFIDMRDKAGKKPFENDDAEAARKIADQVVDLLAEKRLFSLAPIALVEEPHPRPAPAQPQVSRAAAPQPAVPLAVAGFSPDAIRNIEAARQYMTKRQHAQQNGRRSGEGEVEIARLLLPAALSIPGAAVACLTSAGSTSNPQGIVAVAPLADDATELIHAHLQSWLKRANHPHLTVRQAVTYPAGAQPVPVHAQAITAIITAPLGTHTGEGLVLTVAFERTQEATAQRFLQNFLRQMEAWVESAATAASPGRVDRQTLAERLLEPDFQKFPALADHSREVAQLASRFAQSLEIPPAQVETIRLAALVHDVGMRLLDYEQLYQKVPLTAEETRFVAEHPVVGAAIVEPILGSEIAQIVLRHHERFDGKGYPSRLTGPQIPLAARILQLPNAWVAMTSASSYQPPVPHETAVQRLRDGAGTQFDPALVDRFLKALPDLV